MKKKNKDELIGMYNSLTGSTFLEKYQDNQNNVNNNNKINKKEGYNLEDMFWKAIDEINIDSISFKPKLTPFISGLEPNLQNLNIS